MKTSENKIGKYKKPFTFAVKHRNEDTRMASRSGGIFTALSDKVLSEGGVVYGCVMENNFVAVHTRAEDQRERDRMRESKYIQSDLRDTFKLVKADLDAGMNVLFSGTSCQAAGLKSVLGKEYRNLLIVDIVCHGVPSPYVWGEYLKWQEKKNGSEVLSVEFRNKRDFGWNTHIESLYLKNGKQVNSSVFKTMFYGHTILRPSCYKCPYKDIIHPGDITIADYWGIQNAAPAFDDNKGVSLVLVNNDKGKESFDAVSDQIEFIETRLEDSMQPPLIAPFPRPANREAFWRDLREKEFSQVVDTYGTISKKVLFKRRIKKLLGFLYRS